MQHLVQRKFKIKLYTVYCMVNYLHMIVPGEDYTAIVTGLIQWN